MFTLTRPEGSESADFNLSRRAIAAGVFGGYALSAVSADAAPIKTDDKDLEAGVVQIGAGDRLIPAYLARPAGKGPFPTILVISEVFGVHEYIRDICRRLAKLGYVAMAPDFFVRAGDPAATPDTDQVRKIVSATSEPQVMRDVESAVAYLKAHDYVNRRAIGITGFCWGGAVAWLACMRTKHFKAGVAWYGRLTAPKVGEFLGEPGRHWPMEEVQNLRPPVLGLYAGKDLGIAVSDVEKMRQALVAARKTGSEIIIYPNAQHGFHADYRSSYDAPSAHDGWARMLQHFRKNGLAPKT